MLLSPLSLMVGGAVLFFYCSLEKAFPQGLLAGDSIVLVYISVTFSSLGLFILCSLSVLGFVFWLIVFEFFKYCKSIFLKVMKLAPAQGVKKRSLNNDGYYLGFNDIPGVFYIFVLIGFFIAVMAILTWGLNPLDISFPSLLSGVIIYLIVSHYEFNKRLIAKERFVMAKNKIINENKNILRFGPFSILVMMVFLLAAPLSLTEKTFLMLGIRKENVTVYIKSEDAQFLIYKEVPCEKVEIGKDKYVKIINTDVIISSLGKKVILRTHLPENKFFQFSINNDKVIIDTELSILTDRSG